MNAETGTDAAQFPEKEYINGVSAAVRGTASGHSNLVRATVFLKLETRNTLTIGRIWSKISKGLFGLLCTAVLIGWDMAESLRPPQPPPRPPPHLGSHTRVLLVQYLGCCEITVDSATLATWNGACTERWISKEMQDIMFMFHNCSRYKAGLFQKGCIILYFPNKTNSLKLDAVKRLLNCSPFWTGSLWEQRHLKHNCLVLRPLSYMLYWVIHRNMMHSFRVQALQDPPFCSSTLFGQPR